MKTNLKNARFPKSTEQSHSARRAFLVAGIAFMLVGCGAVPVRHVPKLGAISSGKMSDLHGSPPIDVKAGEASQEEKSFGSIGVGKVMGKLSEWTTVSVAAVKANLAARGATIADGAGKTLTITMTKAEVSAIPLIGVSNGKIVLTAAGQEGLNGNFEGTGSSLAPLSAIDGAVEDAIKKLLSDPAVDSYLRK
jgi:hypothetical protein